ncbi:MAG: hypothetical protein ACK5D5_09440 [Bacteroidota bacterium]|jgi:transcriptional regulator with XRE-family HTH domain
MELKEKIISILKEKNYSYKDLADYLGVTEFFLDDALSKKSLDVRTLELISKELRIPLYSFFSDSNSDYLNLKYKKLFQDKLRNESIVNDPLFILKNEIEFLKKVLMEKEEELKKLSS